ncbi:hypothetical protein C8Q79DRAFT_430537 [Trametes meyenii]|nr:hypothetical protein C8Q79DRAFT_430537 [Trametes meyenii]
MRKHGCVLTMASTWELAVPAGRRSFRTPRRFLVCYKGHKVDSMQDAESWQPLLLRQRVPLLQMVLSNAVTESSVPSLTLTFGLLLIGTFLGLVFYGMTIYQTVWYLRAYTSDPQRLKLTVIAVFIADSVHSSLCIATVVPVIIGQSFYARRVCVMVPGLRTYTTMVVGALALCELVTTCVTTVDGSVLLPSALGTSSSVVTLATGLVAESLLTSALIVILYRSRTGIKSTDSLLNVLIVYTINTGLLTSTLAILCLVFIVTQPQNFLYAFMSILTTKSYINSMLVVLNSRHSLAKRTQGIMAMGTLGMTVTMPGDMPEAIPLDRWRFTSRTQLGEENVEHTNTASLSTTSLAGSNPSSNARSSASSNDESRVS